MSVAPGPRGWLAVLRDGVLLAVGTLSVVPVPAPGTVDRNRAAVAMLAAPAVGLAVGAVALLAGAAALLAGLPPLAAAAVALGADALLTRFLHLDGLADTADGLAAAAHGDRDRALEVMRRGDAGPVAVATLLLVLLVAAASLADLVTAAGEAGTGDPASPIAALPPGDAVAAALAAWAASRAVLPLACLRGAKAARTTGLGVAVVGAVPRPAAVACAAAVATGGWLAAGGAGLAACLAALAAGAAVAGGVHLRLGGLTGDGLGASVVVALAAALSAAAAVS